MGIVEFLVCGATGALRPPQVTSNPWTVLDQSFAFTDHADCIYKKAQQKLFLLRKLRSFEVHQYTLTRVYQSLIKGLFTFNIEEKRSFVPV